MSLVYNTKVTSIGPLVEGFYPEKMIILFKDNAPDELADYCVMHSINDLKEDIKEGYTLKIDGIDYKITAVGDVVNKNLRDLGHICLKFDGSTKAALEGTLYLEDKEIKEVSLGSEIQILA
ncbi:PTS system, glucitol/sorbitol-specific, IIA component [Clostridium pasteurianum DSM 525 = ATCC 6013]|jgi:PTS system glucitol/sorbitol-specific IIA component|uniref:PTS system glucitol/sorbitol-specific IIA component n=1 Tax=Clostridium pasteurianum DSM 525 = ATCC 6013 TaxID=1262449 RepID=A0A0H3J4V1_CLOPA|nr:PTS glucitol/sorbitol transporter subunit IIA [Clostridium pasteurianum]AJA48941.1 PTS system, glucitol/sorbitol-specific, IIA component [Clostridium pasteurianum DSM 525 = ATCC 6013]AJA52929.1 PTS system, glucitol/sorbitol-specific, IIA component [Clostridium pasteurianum DSM 525 = ATCC 6013]AOZ76150.1 PTS sorbitol transporter subunit IIA [Clostridium pasteurianum DSM 525 = ATCC 6013]AOZ79946.1 PTS sorbitol transporter subunit IIA [Clostridium pasteurianum]ELP60237.1 PTS system glucitol/so